MYEKHEISKPWSIGQLFNTKFLGHVHHCQLVIIFAFEIKSFHAFSKTRKTPAAIVMTRKVNLTKNKSIHFSTSMFDICTMYIYT